MKDDNSWKLLIFLFLVFCWGALVITAKARQCEAAIKSGNEQIIKGLCK